MLFELNWILLWHISMLFQLNSIGSNFDIFQCYFNWIELELTLTYFNAIWIELNWIESSKAIFQSVTNSIYYKSSHNLLSGLNWIGSNFDIFQCYLNWIGSNFDIFQCYLNWIELNWIEHSHISMLSGLNWIELNRAQPYFNAIWIELNWIELDLTVTYLNVIWIELNWIELNWI